MGLEVIHDYVDGDSPKQDKQEFFHWCEGLGRKSEARPIEIVMCQCWPWEEREAAHQELLRRNAL